MWDFWAVLFGVQWWILQVIWWLFIDFIGQAFRAVFGFSLFASIDILNGLISWDDSLAYLVMNWNDINAAFTSEDWQWVFGILFWYLFCWPVTFPLTFVLVNTIIFFLIIYVGFGSVFGW